MASTSENAPKDARMMKSPCAVLVRRITPKMRVSPTAMMNIQEA